MYLIKVPEGNKKVTEKNHIRKDLSKEVFRTRERYQSTHSRVKRIAIVPIFVPILIHMLKPNT